MIVVLSRGRRMTRSIPDNDLQDFETPATLARPSRGHAFQVTGPGASFGEIVDSVSRLACPQPPRLRGVGLSREGRKRERHGPGRQAECPRARAWIGRSKHTRPTVLLRTVSISRERESTSDDHPRRNGGAQNAGAEEEEDRHPRGPTGPIDTDMVKDLRCRRPAPTTLRRGCSRESRAATRRSSALKPAWRAKLCVW
jgi:hypothetical protein